LVDFVIFVSFVPPPSAVPVELISKPQDPDVAATCGTLFSSGWARKCHPPFPYFAAAGLSFSRNGTPSVSHFGAGAAPEWRSTSDGSTVAFGSAPAAAQ
jgi:hypothetical protein